MDLGYPVKRRSRKEALVLESSKQFYKVIQGRAWLITEVAGLSLEELDAFRQWMFAQADLEKETGA